MKRLLAAALLAAPLSLTLAQEYPNKPIRVVIPYPPGGGNDTGARALAPILERELGIPFVVLNRAGAASQIGMTQVAVALAGKYAEVSTV